MFTFRIIPFRLRLLFTSGLLFVCAWAWAASQRSPAWVSLPPSSMQKRWLFVWRNMSDPKEVDLMIARFPRAQADGYNGIVFSASVPAAKAAELRQAAKKYGLAIIAVVMGGTRD